MGLQGVKPQVRSETVGTRWKSGSIGKPGRRQAKTQRKTCEDRTENSEKTTKNQPKTCKNRRKIGFGRLWALRVVPNRSGVARERAWDGLRAASWAVLAAMLAVLDAKLAARGSSNGARKPSSNACASSNGVRIDFSSFLLRSWKARTSIFVSQCSVSYTSHEVSTERARVTKNHENRRFSASKSTPGASKSSSGGPWRAKNRARICEEPPNF